MGRVSLPVEAGSCQRGAKVGGVLSQCVDGIPRGGGYNFSRLMSHFVKDAWLWIWGWLVYVLPALSNLILVLLGVLLSLPTLAEKIEKTPKYRKMLGVICLIAGIVGFWFDVGQRRTSDQTNRQLLADVSASVKNTNDLVQKTASLVATATQTAITTNQTANSLGVYLPQLEEMNSHIAAIDKRLKTANDPRIIADLQAQKAQLQKQADTASKQLLLATVPGIARQLREIAHTWNMYDEKATLPIGLTPGEKSQRRSEVAKRYSDQARPVMLTAEYLRQQLLERLPSTQTDEDKKEAVVFAKVVAGESIQLGELLMAPQYLEELSKRVAPPPPSPTNLTGTVQ